MIYRLIVFLILNFAALALGAMFTGKGVPSDWYMNLAKAPWTPPGWVFGAAWTTIMICFSIYMAYLWPQADNKNLLIGMYAFQLLLNIAWNPVFFHFNNITGGLIVISTLTVLIGIFLVHYWPQMKFKTIFILPYFIWLLIATSLNTYIRIYN